jgi:D-3-phosphoglycerate dehydrogenase
MKILITDSLSSEGLKILEEAGYEIDRKKLTPDELLRCIGIYDCIIVRSATKLTGDIIAAGINLKVIARAGIGLDNIDLKAAKQHGIPVVSTPGTSAISVAELTIGHMLAVSRFLNIGTAELRQGKWPKQEYEIGVELYMKTLGIIGFGNIGKEVARRALGMGMRVLAYDPMPVQVDSSVDLTTMEQLLRNSDYITLHIPYDKKRGPTIGKQEFDRMKDGVILINCARGGVVDEKALLEALNSRKVMGAALDVYMNEPPGEAQKALLQHPRVSASPHIGGQTIEAQKRIGSEIAATVVKILSSEKK